MTTTSDTQKLDDLKAVLGQELALYAQVETGMMRKKDVLIQGDAQALATLDRELAALAQKTADLEKQRMAAMASLGCENATLGELIGRLPAAQAAPLRELRLNLLRLLGSIDLLNRNNRALLDLSLQWIADTVELIAKALTPEATAYTAQGNLGSTSSPVQSTLERSV